MSVSFPRIFELFNNGLYNEAITLALEKFPNYKADPPTAQAVAACFFKLGKFQECIDILVELESPLADDSSYLSLYAASCRRLGMHKKSELLFKQALKIDPDSKYIKNNFANLLIDLGNYDYAQTLLSEVLSEDPGFADAIQNSNRLRHLLASLPRSEDSTNSAESKVKYDLNIDDPLILAFAEDEVDYSSVRYQLRKKDRTKEVLKDLPNPIVANTAQDHIKLAYKALTDGEFDLGLKLCSQSLSILGPKGFIYDCASDIYLNLKHFHEAETCLLQAVAIDGDTPKRLLNLVSFASMRGDIKLAEYYLSKVASLDPSHPQLSAISNQLKRSKPSKSYLLKKTWSFPEL